MCKRRRGACDSDLILSFQLESYKPVCRCNLSVIPSVPVIPVYCSVSSKGDYNDTLVNTLRME